MAGDAVPHRHPDRALWEYLTGIAAIGALAQRRGIFDSATIGAVAAVLPDAEHAVLKIRIRGGKVFHRRPARDRYQSTGLSARTQTLLAALIIASLLTRGHGEHGYSY